MQLAWGMLLLPAAALAQTLTATDFVKYYDYNGDLAVAGTVTVTTDGTSQTLAYSLTADIDPLCGAGADSGTANSCGIHVHQGTTCTDDAGSHWYDDESISEDPWASVSYIGVTSASDTTDPVDTGYDDAVGRALIIHGYDGGRIACALLTVTVDWKIPTEPQVLSVAAGTTVKFSWSDTHNVYEVPDATAFDACDSSGATEVASTAAQTVDVAAPETPTTKYYVCTVGSHCTMGQKIAITWAAAPTIYGYVMDDGTIRTAVAAWLADATAAETTYGRRDRRRDDIRPHLDVGDRRGDGHVVVVLRVV